MNSVTADTIRFFIIALLRLGADNLRDHHSSVDEVDWQSLIFAFVHRCLSCIIEKFEAY